MVENLLHENVVLSQKQLERLFDANLRGAIGDLDTQKIGTITFLGVGDMHGKTVYLLMRFEKGQYHTPVVPMAIEKVFGTTYTVMYGNNLDSRSEPRVLITCELPSPVRNALGFMAARSHRFMETLVDMEIQYFQEPEA